MAISITDDRFDNEPLSDTLKIASKIEGIDIKSALIRISWRQNVLEDSIRQASYLIDDKLRKMASFLSSEDLINFSIEAHGLKSALAGIGASKLSELASELEKASKIGELLFCKGKFIAFARSMKEFAEELKSIFPAKSTAEKLEGDSEQLFRAIKEVACCLEDFEADDAIEHMNKLCGFTFGDEIDALLNQITIKIKSFKYGEAIMLLKSISG